MAKFDKFYLSFYRSLFSCGDEASVEAELCIIGARCSILGSCYMSFILCTRGIGRELIGSKNLLRNEF